MVLGIMVEDGVQALWKRVQPASDAKESDAEGDAPPFWIRAVGFLWVMVWLGVTSTWYFHPMSHLPQEETFLVPFSLVERVGIEPLGAVLLVCGIGLYVGFGVEI